MKIPTYFMLVGATLIFCFGSLIGTAAPGDGQTGMFLFPLWILGGLGLLAASLLCGHRPKQGHPGGRLSP